MVNMSWMGKDDAVCVCVCVCVLFNFRLECEEEERIYENMSCIPFVVGDLSM